MNFEILFDYISEIQADIIIKLLLSLLFGLLIGLERELTNKTAGLRTHILVCVGATVFTILSIYGFSDIIRPGIQSVNDPSRIAAQIVTGIGFIGGGAVLHYGVNVFGLTTAATLWITASIGMAVGAGSFFLAGFAAFLTFIVLVGIRKLENIFLSRYAVKGGRIKVTVSCLEENQPDIHKWFYSEFKNIQEISTDRFEAKEGIVKITFVLDIQKYDPINIVYEKISNLSNVESFSVKQIMM